jgi:threonine aldolase
MAEILAECKSVSIDLVGVQTNIVLFSVPDAPALVTALKAEGILCSAIGPRQVRLVTHCDVSFEECEWAAKRVAALLAS